MRSPKLVKPARPYRMRRRAEHVDDTTRRITEAAVRLHTTVGPSKASIAAIAEEAGVTRLTVYRHFGDAEQLFMACMAHHAALHPWPDAAVWSALPSLETRARAAVTALYAWFAEHGADIAPIERDAAFVPAGAKERIRRRDAAYTDSIVGDASGERLRAVVGHVTELSTWHSLVVEQGLAAEVAVDLVVSWVVAAA